MYAKSVLEAISRFHGELTAFRQDMHAHPELGFQEIRASDRVAKALTALGYQVHRNVGKTGVVGVLDGKSRSEEHTSELQSLMRISYAVFCLKKKNSINDTNRYTRELTLNR